MDNSITKTSSASLKFCSECGQKLKAQYQFCIRCGRLCSSQTAVPAAQGEPRLPEEAGVMATGQKPTFQPQPKPQPVLQAEPDVIARQPALRPAPSSRTIPEAPSPAPTLGEQEESGNLLGGWVFSVVAGAYAVATVAVANVILWVVSFSLAAGYEWVGGSGWFIVFALFMLVLLVSLGAPVLIILGGLGAIVGAIAGGVVGAGIGLVCLLGYLLGGVHKPLRPIIMYPSAAGLAVFLYGQLAIYREFLNSLPYSVWIDYLNFLLAGVAGLVIAWSFLVKPVEQSQEESESNWQAAKDFFGAPWRFYRRAGRWASDAHEKEQRDYTFHRALGVEKSRDELQSDLRQAWKDYDMERVERVQRRIKEVDEKEK